MRVVAQIIISLLIFVGCCEEEQTTPDFTIDRSVVDISAQGGVVDIAYTLKTQNTLIKPIAKCDAEWITDIDNSQSGKISFRVLLNESNQMRETVVEFRAVDASYRPTLRVKQSGSGVDMLSIEVVSVDYSSCDIKLSPVSDTMPYVVMVAEKRYFAEYGIVTADDLVGMDLSRFYSNMSGEDSVEEYIHRVKIANYGEQTKHWQDLSPAKEYVVYAYGIYVKDDRYERATPVYHIVIDDRLEERATQNFTIDIVTQGPELTFSVEPETWNGYYMVQLVEDSEAGYIEQGLPLGEEFEVAVAEAFFYISDHLYYFEQMSAEEIMAQLGYSGKSSFSKTLNANHRYMAIVYAIDSVEGNVPMMVSNATVKYFSTGGVERSDMTFDVRLENIRARSVDVTITPSTDETYTAVMMYAKSLPEADKQQQLDYVMSKYEPLELRGPYEEHINQLPPSTEFVIAVCGYYAGEPTTDLFIYSFTTLDDGVGTNKVVSAKFSAFDIAEVAALEPYYSSMAGYADYFLSMELETMSPAPSLHFELYAKSQFDSYTLEDIRESMLESAYTSSPDWALCSYGNEYVLCALAENEKGHVGEMYVSEPISFTREQTSDAAIFVELYKEYVEPKAMILGK